MKSTEGVLLCIIIEDVHQFIDHCLIRNKLKDFYILVLIVILLIVNIENQE